MNRIIKVKISKPNFLSDLLWRYTSWNNERQRGYRFRELGHHCAYCHKLIKNAVDCVSLGSPLMTGDRNSASHKKCLQFTKGVYVMDNLRLEHWGWERFLR